MVYTEEELIIPALKLLNTNESGLTTTQLIKQLEAIMNPIGKDAETITGRKDTYFSQKVRNLKSHDNLTKKELTTYENEIWKITPKGKNYLEENEDVYISLLEQGFEKKAIAEEVKKDFEGIIIEEGVQIIKDTKQRKRSNKLREIAIKELIKENKGELFCEVCAFNFLQKYGEIGRGFIEIHHKTMVSEMNIEGEKSNIEEALKKIAPLCSNCHRMIHRNKDKMLSTEELKKLLQT